MDGDVHGLMTPSGDAAEPHELLAFERVAARLIGRPHRRVAIGRYRMREELGRGGFGAVYAAHDPELNRDVAVKLVLPRKGQKDPKWEARLVREAQTLARVEHPNVVSVYDVGVDAESGGVYVVMELLDGVSARRWLEGKGAPRPAQEHIIDAYIGAARGLAAAHALGIVHRDLKPDNVMVTRAGEAKVIDFGLARDVGELDSTRSSGTPASSRSASTKLTSMGTVMGTPPYMAPEQHALGEIGPAADQYALCVALYEALCGVRPFEDEDAETLVAAKRAMRLVAPPKGSRLPRAVRRVILRGLEPKPGERWASMDALADALSDAAQPRRRAFSVGAVGVGIVALAVLAGRNVAFDEDPCASAATRAAQVWSPARAQGLQSHILGELHGAEATAWTAAQARLDTRFKAWRASIDSACAAADERQIECLDQWMTDADTVVTVLEEESVVPAATLGVVDTIPRLELCGVQRTAAIDDVPLRDGFTRARALARAGSGARALQLADDLVTESRETGDAGLMAQAMLSAGIVYAERERLEDARRSLIESNEHATSAGLDAIAAEAAIVLVRVCGAMGQWDDAHRWTAVAEARMARLGNPPYLRTLLLGARAFELIYEGDYARAHAISEELVDQLQGDDQRYERARAMANVALTAFELGRVQEARTVAAEARTIMISVLGANHPSVGRMHADEGRYAAAIGEVEEGVASMERAVRLLEAAGGPNDPYALNTKRTLAHYLARLGRHDESLEMLEQTYESTVALYGAVHVRTATTGFALADQYLMADRPDDAEPIVREAITSLTELYGAGSPRLAVGSELLGRTLALRGKTDEARDVVTRALAGLSDATPDQRESTVNLLAVLAGLDQDDGRLDDAARNLAHALELTKSDPSLSDPAMQASLEGRLSSVESERERSETAAAASR
ncbi:MAG: protein kinase domain-containing protein [Nannocystaceae bacterium]